MTTKKEDILKILKKSGRTSTTHIAGLLNFDYNTALKYLNELLEENKIVKEKETIATYWRLKNE